MSLSHRLEFLDDMYQHLSNMKNANISEQLRLTLSITLRRLNELRKAIRELLASPEGQGLEQGKIFTVEEASRAPLDTEMLYVKTLAQLAYIHNIKLAGGIHLGFLNPAAKADLCSKENIAKLVKKQHQLEKKMCLTQPWTSDMLVYKVLLPTLPISHQINVAWYI